MSASYPGTIKTFSTFVNGDDIDAANQNEPNDEITAIETGLLQGVNHNLQAPGFRFDAAASKTIASGVITITSGYLVVDTEGAAAADDLDTITIGVMADGVAIGEGSIIVLRGASAARVVTVKTATGNIRLLGGDYAMTSLLSRIALMYDGTNWVELARSGAGVATWTTPAYSAGNFTASSGSWGVDSGDVTTYAYLYDASTHTMTLAFIIQATDVTATPTNLRIAIPLSKVATKQMESLGYGQDASSTNEVVRLEILAAGTYVSVYRLSGTWSTTASDNTTVVGQITFQVN